MARDDERSDDRGRGSRGADVKTWLQIVSLVLACAAIVWKGGQMTEKLDHVAANVQQYTEHAREIATSNREIKVRVDAHDKEIANHENRIVRIETRERAGR